MWLARKAKGGRIQHAVLQVLEGTAVKVFAPALGGNRNVTELREFGIVVELGHSELADEF
jgi:hypothetical protein